MILWDKAHKRLTWEEHTSMLSQWHRVFLYWPRWVKDSDDPSREMLMWWQSAERRIESLRCRSPRGNMHTLQVRYYRTIPARVIEL